MKQVSNSLLTLCINPFSSNPDVEAPRKTASAAGRHLTPFFVHQGSKRGYRSILLNLSCPPRSLVRYRLGEGRIRSLLYGFCLSFFVLLFFSAPIWCIAAVDRVADLNNSAAVNAVKAPPTENAALPVVQAKMSVRPVSVDEIASILKSHFAETTSWKESEIVIRAIGDLKGIDIPRDGAEMRLSSSATIAGQRRILAPIEVLQYGKNLRNFWVSAEVCIHADVVTATKRIVPGKIITAGDIEIKNAEITNLRASYAGRPDEVVGKISRRNFSPGDPLTRDSFSDPYLVRNGETVRLRLERDGIVLTSLAKAEQDGRLGQIIRVRNADFSKVLKAQVTGRAEVKLE
jgi:flagella basal body P-ring formation protein FlgA